MWDDAQKWAINIKRKDSLQTVYSNNIQLGRLMVYFDESKNDICLVENAPFQKAIFKLDRNNNFNPVEIQKMPDNTNMVL